MRSSPTEIQRALRGADYPADRHYLVGRAEENEADDDVLADLDELDEEEYETPSEVMSDLAGEDED